MEPPSHGHMEESILEIQSASPHGLHYTQGDGLDGFHLEVRDNQVFVQPGEVEHRAERAIFLGDEEEAGEEDRLLKRCRMLPDDIPGQQLWNEVPEIRNLSQVRQSAGRGMH